MSFSMPNEADDIKARTFLEEQDSFAEKNRDRPNSGRDTEVINQCLAFIINFVRNM